ncbi:MAG: hypothetical protein AAFQ75_04005 [Pseudomonadota bacterium]
MTRRGGDFLDTSCLEDQASYERAFHAAFRHLGDDPLLRRLWRWNDEDGRIASPVSYGDQIVHVERNADGAIYAAIAANVGGRRFQASAFGFGFPADERPGCELLVFFVLRRHALEERYRFWSRCFADLRERGFEWGVATTARRALRFYERIGGEVVETIGTGADARFLVRFDLDRDWIRPREAGSRRLRPNHLTNRTPPSP